mgnify:CR=1 FL=1
MHKNKYLIILVLTIMVISFTFLLTGCDNKQTTSITEDSYTVAGVVEDNEGNGIEEVTIKFSDHGTAETNNKGEWQKDGLSGTVTINPAKENYTFTPDSIEVSEPKENISIKADKKDYSLNIDVKGSGSVKQSPSYSALDAGTVVELTAEADTGYKFDHWEGDISGNNNPVSVTMDENKSITAVFVEKDYSLETNTEGEGTINEREISNNEVELTANPNTGWKFDHWEGDLSGSNNPETIIVDSPKSVTAVFVKKSYSLSINTEGSGTVSKSPNQTNYDYGTEVQLTASADSNWYFNYWEGDLTGSNNPATITIDSNKSITAVFAEQSTDKNEFTLNVGDAGSVTVTEPDGSKVTVNENDTYSYTTQQSATLSLSANPQDARYKFDSWSGDYSSSNKSIDITVDNDMVVNANFKGNVFKLINSWGSTWGPNGDGSLYITYDAAKQVNLNVWVLGKRNNYQAEALALFDVEGSNRGEWTFTIKTSDSEKSFYPDGQYLKGGSASFPSNKIALDITELLPFDGEDIVLQVTNNSSSSGTIESFAVEVNGSKFDANISNVTVSGNSTETITIPKVSASASAFAMDSSDDRLESVAREIKNSDIEAYINNKKRVTRANKIINGHGTGWKNLTREEWVKAKKHNSIKVLDAKDVVGQFHKASDIDSSIQKVDYSKSIHFPPVRSQGSEGSCASWSIGYYIKSYYEAEDHGWDLSRGDNSKIMSPDFVYHLINGGNDGGSYYTDNTRVIENIGISSWSSMPYSDSDHTSWPSEAAFKEAADYRSALYNGSTGYYIQINDDSDIAAVQSILSDGYLITVSIDADKYTYLTENGVWTKDNYNNVSTNHANTMVGYYE